MKLSNHAYDILNDLVKVGLPAVGAFYAALAIIWGLPFGEAVVGTIAALSALGGVFLKILSKGYEPPVDGVVDIDVADPEHATVRLNMGEDPQNYTDGATVNLRVSSNSGRYGIHEN